jgi:hypothetical protein
MNKYKFTPDGFTFEASSPLQIVEVLRDSGMFTADQDLETYMTEFSERLKIMYGFEIASTSADNLVAGMLEHKLIERIE